MKGRLATACLFVYSIIMPRRELHHPHQVTDWLKSWGAQLRVPGEMILIGSAGLLWHAA
jgi:hypothetical protein